MERSRAQSKGPVINIVSTVGEGKAGCLAGENWGNGSRVANWGILARN
jgi:hypothetical protein